MSKSSNPNEYSSLNMLRALYELNMCLVKPDKTCWTVLFRCRQKPQHNNMLWVSNCARCGNLNVVSVFFSLALFLPTQRGGITDNGEFWCSHQRLAVFRHYRAGRPFEWSIGSVWEGDFGNGNHSSGAQPLQHPG